MNILFFFLLLFYLNNSIEKESKYIELDIDCEKFCTIPVSFGSNDEVFTLQLDTTTSDSWIPSTKFDLDVPQYNILNSKNGKRTNKTIEIEDEEGIIYEISRLTAEILQSGSERSSSWEDYIIRNEDYSDKVDRMMRRLNLEV